jgi:alpha-2-macroglobulin
VFISFFLFSCSNNEYVQKQNLGTYKKIIAHTPEIISSKDSILIKFQENIVAEDQVKIPLKTKIIEFDPQINGKTLWKDEKTLAFIPDAILPEGQRYLVKVILSDFMETTDLKEKVFEFNFSVAKQMFEIELNGLQTSNASDISVQELTGKIITEDITENIDIEKILTASYEKKDLNIKWIHDNQNKMHSFVIEGIHRKKETDSHVLVKWDGKSIGVLKKGKRSFLIPPLSAFKVVQIRPVQGGTQYIEMRFSDPLKKNQILKGLIRTGKNSHGLRFVIDRNIIRIYNSQLWFDKVNVKIDRGIRNVSGIKLQKPEEFIVSFEKVKPLVRFAGKGVIYPTNPELSIPIEAVNLNAVKIKAIQILENNVPQFLQVNNLDGKSQLHRVGSVLFEKIISLDTTESQKDQWIRYGLDISTLIDKNKSGLFRLEISFDRRHILYDCTGSPFDVPKIKKETNETDSSENGEEENSNWDYFEDNEDYDYYEYYDNRKNPCHPAYYKSLYGHDVKVSRNVIVSDIGLIAKTGSDHKLFVAVTDIKTAKPLSDVSVSIYNYQHELISTAITNADGIINIDYEKTPYLAIAKNGLQRGFLRLDGGQALSMSHFDTSGAQINKGLKGFIYAERGVWRPGDPVFLTLILKDEKKKLPDNHPVIFELRNPNNQLVKRIKKTTSMNGFYTVKFVTDQDAMTGNWDVKVKVGGVTFQKPIKIETVMPNRLKVNIGFGEDVKSLKGGLLQGELSSTWLHGAVAKNLDADVELSFSTGRTVFPKYAEFVFDDPVRRYEPENQFVFEGKLDAKGKAQFKKAVWAKNVSPGMLQANFTTTVFEPGGAFSIDRFSIPYHPYDRYVGIKTPKGDRTRGMLLTDTEHIVEIAMLDNDGQPSGDGEVEVELYKIKWRWWWAKGGDHIADYLGKSSYRAIQDGRVTIKDGKGEWRFDVKYPDWGRYLVRVRDLKGKHSTGKIIYIDWPGWAGRSTDNSPGGASVLNFFADKKSYTVGEKVVLTIPTAKNGRGLLSFETGSKLISSQWFEAADGESTKVEFTASKEMSPNVYVNVTFLQPHMQTHNDHPIRMYGVIPINVFNPGTQMKPLISCPDVFAPDESVDIKISEETAREMTYTLAIVDEGLLDLTRFKTPNPWNHFYKKESIGVWTWDIFNYVVGAYGGTLENILAIGGDGSLLNAKEKKANRFPPMVRFMGPFYLEKGQENTHKVDIPQYLGSVRVMVVSGNDSAFGFSEKAVFVRKPLMLLGTLPRVIGPDEEVSLPVSVFAMEENIKEVEISVDTNNLLSIEDEQMKTLSFSEIGDQIITFKLKAGFQPGIGNVTIRAKSGDESAKQTIELDVRVPNSDIIDVVRTTLENGQSWNKEIVLPGVAGTNSALLEVSRIPPLNLGKRLEYLIKYPHGCVEQTTSSVFPQLYLNKILQLSPDKQDRIQKNVTAAIYRLRNFQKPGGGFGYWPGTGEADKWSTNYTGHFLVEAEKLGYTIPVGMIDDWKIFQIKQARTWTTGSHRSELIQAYRLYTLALAGSPELGAMNRLLEQETLTDPARFRLGAAYQLAGQPEAALKLIKNARIDIEQYTELSNTYGSDIRDKAMILESLCLLGKNDKAKSLADEISDALNDEKYMSTQTTAYSLIAMAVYSGVFDQTKNMTVELVWNDGIINMESSSPVLQQTLKISDGKINRISFKNNNNFTIYPRLILTGIPPVGGEEKAENGMRLEVGYFSLKGDKIDPSKLSQGTDFMAEVVVYNTGKKGVYEEVALTHIFPSGWEIHNERMDPNSTIDTSQFEYQDIRDDRIYTYFNVKQNDKKVFKVLLNASYLGKYYLPMVKVEAMYDGTINARIPGQWVAVEK